MFSARVKAFCDSSGARSAGDRLYQVCACACVCAHSKTEKLLSDIDVSCCV